MEFGFVFEAAKPKGLRSSDDAPSIIPMRPRQVVQKNPTTDQKKERRRIQRAQRTASSDEQHEAAVTQDGLDLDLAHHLRQDHGVFVRNEDSKSVQDQHDRAHDVGHVFHSHEASLHTAVFEGIHHCLNCDQRIRPTGYDDVPWVHHGSGNAFCDVTHPEDAVRNSVFNPTGLRTEAEPREASRKTATEIPSNADKLRPGDVIRGPNNTTVTVKQVRLHKADSSKVLVDTEAGTLVVPRNQAFTLVPVNNRQREVPDQGPVAGSPVGDLPMGGRGQQDPSQGHQGDVCPVCGARMQLRRANGNALYICPRDGYSVQANGIGAATDPDLLPQRRSTLQTEAERAESQWSDMSLEEKRDHLNHGHALNADMSERGLDQAHNIAHAPGWISGVTGEPIVLNHHHGSKTADMRGKAECRACGGKLLTDVVDHTENTVHAHCQDCGMEHQLQNAQHATGAKKEWVVVKDFDPYITTVANTKSAIARRAQAVLNMEEL